MHTRQIVVIGLLVIASSSVAVFGQSDNAEQDCAGELKRLRKAFDAAHAERAKMAAELGQAKKRIVDLEATQPVDPNKPLTANEPRALIVQQYRRFVSIFRSPSTYDEARYNAMMLRVLHGSLVDECKASAASRALFDPARQFMEEAVRVADAQVDELSPDSEKRYERRARELLSRMKSDPEAMAALLKSADRVTAAKIAGEVVGEFVAWRGTVIESLDYAVVPWHIVLDCAGMTVRAKLAGMPRPELAKLGATVTVMGKVSAVNSDPAAGIFLLVNADLADVTAVPPAIRQRRHSKKTPPP